MATAEQSPATQEQQLDKGLKSGALGLISTTVIATASVAPAYSIAATLVFVVGAVAIGVAILLGKDANVAFLVALAFAVAASANLPVIVLSLFWKRFNTTGAVLGLATGLVASLALIIISPSIMKVDPPGVVGAARHLIQHPPIFPLENPGILSIPLGFLGAILGTLLSRHEQIQARLTAQLAHLRAGDLPHGLPESCSSRLHAELCERQRRAGHGHAYTRRGNRLVMAFLFSRHLWSGSPSNVPQRRWPERRQLSNMMPCSKG